MLNTELSSTLQKHMINEPGQTIPIAIELPECVLFEKIETIDEVKKTIEELTPFIDNVALNAYEKNDYSAWSLVQTMMYLWNYREVTRKGRVSGLSYMVETYFRNRLMQAQFKHETYFALSCHNDFTPEKAVQELSDKAHNHRINTHPLLVHMAENGLSKDDARIFLENYYVNNRLFHLFIVGLSLSSPLERRTELANNFYDELGSGDSAMQHPKLFLKNFDTIGRSEELTPQPEALSLVNAKTYAAFLDGDYHYGMGGFGFIELTMPVQMEMILEGLKKTGLPRPDLEFWELHITVDLEHGKTWFSEMLELIKTPEQAQACLTGGMRLLEARASMYDGIWNAINGK